MKKEQRYKSPSTEDVAHDASNLLVEALMINRYGLIPSGAWRKDSVLQKEWSELVKVVKRLCKSMSIDPAKLAWYIQKYRVGSLDYEEFGLVRWKIDRIFGRTNLEDFATFYGAIYKSQIKESSAYVEATTTYKVKAPEQQRKTLQEILQEIENGPKG